MQSTRQGRVVAVLERIVAPILLCLASLMVVLVHVPQHTTISIVDEYVYIDYLAKVPTQGVVHRGEEVGDFTRHYLDCHGVNSVGFYDGTACTVGDVTNDQRFPQTGQTSADLYTPLYFAPTWLLAQPLVLAGVDLVDAGRYVGAVWLAAAALFLYAALRRLKIPWIAGFGLGLMMIGSPAAFWSTTYISTDAPAFLVGAALLYAVTRYRPDRVGWALIAISVVGTLIKVQNIAAAGAVGLAFAIMGLRESIAEQGAVGAGLRGALRSRRAWTGVAMIVASLVAQVLWMGVRSLIAVGPAPDQGISQPLTPTTLIDELFRFFGTGAYGPAPSGTAMAAGAAITLWLMVAGVLGAVAIAPRNSLLTNLGGSLFVVALALGPALAVLTLALSGVYFTLPVRYGMSLTPLMFACAAWLFTRKPVLRWGLLAAGAVTFVAGLAIDIG